MYNYQPPGQFGRQPPYGSYPGAPGASAPGMGPPPAMGGANDVASFPVQYYDNYYAYPLRFLAPPGTGSAPGVSPPPGMNQSSSPLPARPGGLPPNFQPPANMPNINFNAPVIRLGMSTPSGKGPSTPTVETLKGSSNTDMHGNRGRMGLGAGLEQQRQQVRESMMALAPPTREEIMRTIFIGNLTEGVGGDAGMERILQAASGNKLRRWTRSKDDGKPCKFGFAEFEDAEGLETAIETLTAGDGVEVPVERVELKKERTNVKMEDKEDGEEEEEKIQKTFLGVFIDNASREYAEEWRQKRAEDANAAQFRVDAAREELSEVIASLFRPTATNGMDFDPDTAMQDLEARADPITGEVITIPITVEDELSDIPANMRETVAAEIAAFRERSNKRDLERVRKEEEIEAKERRGGRVSRLASPPLSAPSGPAGGANGIPLGPRADRGVHGAPTGPKGYQGVQIPKDYQNGVTFVNGSDTSELDAWLAIVTDDSDASDREMERRRRERKKAKEEEEFREYERRWLRNQERRRAALQRQREADEEDEKKHKEESEAMAKRLADFDDDEEAVRKTEDFYKDREGWIDKRKEFRKKEEAWDKADREAEAREKAEEEARARGFADSFLDRQASELGERLAAQSQQPARFQMSLGAAMSKRAQQTQEPKRTTALEIESFLDAEEEEDTSVKRTLVPIQFDPSTKPDQKLDLTEEERDQMIKQLATEIPTEKGALFGFEVKWDYLKPEIIEEKLKPFIEKKVVELLGVQEETLIDVIENAVRDRKKPADLVSDLAEALDEDADGLVKKLWRMIIFFSESEFKGLGT
ncbi:hypothetical protein NA57DRAFT_60928 [Rhizodiscina lignyota]|uniref:PWI domain-containing protein n=1 Tax=Rhizodiscina lignyota TaxID=1504668 RepID=A0A9P4I7F1_9PEZI|nr:hypothetical protein NA57DRAFT_60928 [Rhizodiscina lignyota]